MVLLMCVRKCCCWCMVVHILLLWCTFIIVVTVLLSTCLCRLLVQIHDELLLEVADTEVDAVAGETSYSCVDWSQQLWHSVHCTLYFLWSVFVDFCSVFDATSNAIDGIYCRTSAVFTPVNCQPLRGVNTAVWCVFNSSVHSGVICTIQHNTLIHTLCTFSGFKK